MVAASCQKLYQKMAEMERLESPPRAAVSCQKYAEMGEGEGLLGYALSCHKIDEKGGDRAAPILWF